ncbi:MAG: hypothetical protein ACR2F8_08620 [Caulobacteraceae bacterium]
MFRKEKRTPAEELARDLAGRVLDPDACRRAAATLPGRPAPDPVGSCEMAFAGAATLKHLIADTQPPAIAARMNGVVDAALAEAFGGANTPETGEHYGQESLPQAAAKAVERYGADAFFSKRVAETVAARLGIAGKPPPRTAQVFSDITRDAALAIAAARIE